MSAPPIGTISMIPNASDRTATIGNSSFEPGFATRMPTRTSAVPRTERLITFWPRYVMGRWGSHSMSFPAAIRLPVNVRNPSTTSIPRATMVTFSMCGDCR